MRRTLVLTALCWGALSGCALLPDGSEQLEPGTTIEFAGDLPEPYGSRGVEVRIPGARLILQVSKRIVDPIEADALGRDTDVVADDGEELLLLHWVAATADGSIRGLDPVTTTGRETAELTLVAGERREALDVGWEDPRQASAERGLVVTVPRDEPALLEVTVGEVTQVVDLDTQEVERPDETRLLYQGIRSSEMMPCADTVVHPSRCFAEVREAPYVDELGWAPADRPWWVVTVTASTEDAGRYAVESVDVDVALAGRDEVTVLRPDVEDGQDWEDREVSHWVFDEPGGAVEASVAYALRRVAGPASAPPTRTWRLGVREPVVLDGTSR